MLFFSVFVLMQMRSVVLVDDKQKEQKLTNKVIDYYNSFGITANEKRYSTPTALTPVVFDIYAKNIELILTHMYSKRCELLPELDESTSSYEVSEPSEHEKTMCWLLPRCLDVYYLFTKKVRRTVVLYESLTKFCDAWFKLVTDECRIIKNIDNSIYVCDSDTMSQLVRKTQAIGKTEMTYTPNDNGIEKNDMDYVFDIFTFADGINEKSVIRSDGAQMTSELFTNPLHMFGTKYKSSSMIVHESLTNNFMETNTRYLSELENGNCHMPRFNVTPKSDRSLSMVLVLLTDAFKGLGRAFDPYKVLDNYGWTGIVDGLSNTLEMFCKNAPLALVYLVENYSKLDDAATDNVPNNYAMLRVPFGLYFTYCRGWTDFVKTHCPGILHDNEGTIHNMMCVMSSASDNVHVNYSEITGESLILDPEFSDCAKIRSDYVADVVNFLKEYYPEKLWTNCGWLTGEDLIVGDLGAGTDEALVKRITLVDDKSVTLSDAFRLLLPWNSNQDTVFQFHNIVAYNVDLTVNGYVYRIASATVSYLEQVKNDVDDIVKNMFKNALTEYVAASKVVYNYLCLSGLYSRATNLIDVPRVSNCITADDLINVSKNIITHIQNAFQQGLNEFKNFKNNTDGTIEGTRTFIIENCKSATIYIHKFFSIVQESLDDGAQIFKFNC